MKRLTLLISALFSMTTLVVACNFENGHNTSKNSNIHSPENEEITDYIWDDNNEISINLMGSSATCQSGNVNIQGGTVTIKKSGYYDLTGVLSNGQVLVNADSGIVKIKLNNASVSNSNTAPFYGKKASKIILFLANGTTNSLTDGNNYSNTRKPSSCLFASCYLGITGDGNLHITGNYKNGISSNNGITINNGRITVRAQDDGIKAKNFVTVNGGNSEIKSISGHCFKSDNGIDQGYGYIRIKGGTHSLTSSHKDGLHAAKRVIIDSCTISISAPMSQAITADSLVLISGGNITSNNCNEGIESFNITVTGGTTLINAKNDAINATAGTVSGGAEYNDNSSFNMKNGIVVANSSNGDGVDSNGNAYISGGMLIVNGPQFGIEEGADINGKFQTTGGLIVCAGSNSEMTKSISTSSSQVNMFIKSSSLISSGSLLHIEDQSGNSILTVKPKNGGYYFVISSPNLVKGGTYKIYSGGTYTGGTFMGEMANYGIYTGGSYDGSKAGKMKSVTLSEKSTVNNINF